jgi:hypothetical protein
MLKHRVRMIGTITALNAHAVNAVKQFRITITLIRNIQKQLNNLTKHNSKICGVKLGTKQVIHFQVVF